MIILSLPEGFFKPVCNFLGHHCWIWDWSFRGRSYWSDKIPDTSRIISLLTQTLPALLQKEFAKVFRFAADIMTKAEEVMKDPATVVQKFKDLTWDLVWAVYDAVKAVLGEIWELFGKCLLGTFDIIEGVWKVPAITSVYEWMTGQVRNERNQGFLSW